MNKLGLSVLVVAALSSASCTRGYITGEALEYNKALSQNMQEEILLNAVRASKRRPMSFTAIGGLQGTVNRKFGTTPSSLVRTVDLGLSVSADLNNVANFENLNQQQFYNDIRKEITSVQFKYYVDNNWPRDVVYMIMVQKIVVPAGTLDYLWSESLSNQSGNDPRAEALKSLLQEIGALANSDRPEHRTCRRIKKRVNDVLDGKKFHLEPASLLACSIAPDKFVAIWNSAQWF